ncbi:MAG: T9SS type A sorting domain-containing protein [Saprospiraceae bacterium]|nr:T9SS type A sorting domain-containing protein [Saprospiraceae bacterium]
MAVGHARPKPQWRNLRYCHRPRNTLYTVGYAGAPAQATVSRICDPIWFYRDSDQDGYGNSEEAVFDCYPLPMYVDNEWDCDDTNPDIHPGVEEICNEVDDNCDGFIDEGFDQDQDGYTSCSGDCDDNNELLNPGTVWFKDADHDGFTDYEILQQCEQPNGYVDPITLISIAFDCDDTNPLINPNAPDPCNGVDDNCDGTIDEGLTWYKDLDGDGYSDGQTLADCVQPVGYTLPENLEASDGDCDDTNPNTYPGAPELCNGLDDNCNELFDEIFPDNDFDGFSTCAGDCDDTNPDINPYTMWWKDDDNDGYSDGAFLQQCEQPAGFKLSNQLIASYGDCDDLDPAINPDAMETCNHLDDNCDGLTDNDISDWGQGFTWVGNVTFRYQYQIDAWPPCYKVIQGKLNISGSQITSLGPLLGLRQVTGKVEIIKTRLNDLYGLDSLLSVGGDLAIWRNGALFSLQGLNQLQAVGQRLDILQNNQLSDCCPIQPLIASGGVGGAMRITGNATGCESPLAIATACNQPAPKHSQPGLPADEPALLVNAYPNPVNDVLYLEGFSETPLELTIQIRNIQGQLLWTQEISLPEGPFTLDIPEFNHWPQGVYGIMLKNDNLPAEVLRIVKL